jgi:hypothetical protein
MAVVFLLGPGMWDTVKRPATDPTPLRVRREMAHIFIQHDHSVILMEDDPDREGEDYIRKFDRLLRGKVTDVVLYWPPLAKMQTTYDELILLCDRRVFLKKHSIRLWALHHSSVARISKDEFKVLETGNRSRYLTAVARIELRPLEWDDEDELDAIVRLLAMELQ